MNDLLVSIIVPIYNEEENIRFCLDSLRRQSYSNIEILMVNDGSTDLSENICKEYCGKDTRFKYIYIDNSGVSVARNTGIKKAKGKFIGFCDADDWFDDSMIEKMVNQIQTYDGDFVICDMLSTWDRVAYKLYTLGSIEKSVCILREKITSEMLLEMAGSSLRCLYKRELIDAQVYFPQGIKLSEDRIFNLLYISKCSKIVYFKEPLVYAYNNMGSAVHRIYDDYFNMVLNAYKLIRKAINDYWGNEYINGFEKQFIWDCFHGLDGITIQRFSVKQYENIKTACNIEELRHAIEVSNINSVRARLIIKRKYIILLLCEKVLHLKRKLSKKNLWE